MLVTLTDKIYYFVLLWIIFTSKAASKKKGTCKKAVASSAGTKRRKKKQTGDDDDLDSDGEDGVPGGELRRIQKQIIHTCLEGKAQLLDALALESSASSSSGPTKPKSFKRMKSQAAKTMDAILEKKGSVKNCDIAKFKKGKLNPIVKQGIAAIDDYVTGEAAKLKQELLGDFLSSKFTFSDEEYEDDDIDEGDVGGNKDEEKMDDEELVVDSGRLSEGEIDGAKKVVEDDVGSNDDGSYYQR